MEELLRQILEELRTLNAYFARVETHTADIEKEHKEKMEALSATMPPPLQGLFKTFTGGKQ